MRVYSYKRIYDEARHLLSGSLSTNVKVAPWLLTFVFIAIAPCFAGEAWFNQQVIWKYGKEGLEWNTVIKNPHGEDNYRLALRPLWAMEGGIVSVEIVLARQSQPTVNLLGERQNHVEYPFVITVEELERGVAKSKFGAVRDLQVGNIVLHVTIESSRLGRGLGSFDTFCKKCSNIQELSTHILVKSKTRR